jgi:hypothetical protein
MKLFTNAGGLAETNAYMVVDEASWPELRALTLELNRHRD